MPVQTTDRTHALTSVRPLTIITCEQQRLPTAAAVTHVHRRKVGWGNFQRLWLHQQWRQGSPEKVIGIRGISGGDGRELLWVHCSGHPGLTASHLGAVSSQHMFTSLLLSGQCSCICTDLSTHWRPGLMRITEIFLVWQLDFFDSPCTGLLVEC